MKIVNTYFLVKSTREILLAINRLKRMFPDDNKFDKRFLNNKHWTVEQEVMVQRETIVGHDSRGNSYITGPQVTTVLRDEIWNRLELDSNKLYKYILNK